ncbi:MAG: hypothetical protein C0506_02220 [Anaerolinea sp.]|nr:hypothetical protein [Anaerolinea sp.]
MRNLGFTGPFAGPRHEQVELGPARLPIPSYNELSVPKLRDFLSEVEELLGREITLEEWTEL